MDHIKVGKIGEEIAVKYLKNNKYKIICRNYRKKFGEIDIVAFKGKILFFIEVKTLSSGGDEFSNFRPIDKIDKRKMRRLENAIAAYISEYKVTEDQIWRLAAILITLDKDEKKAELEFIDNLY